MSLLGTFGGAVSGVLGGLPGGDPVSGLVSSAAGSLVSDATAPVAHTILQAVSSWVLAGTESALKDLAGAIGQATAPNLQTTWFSSTYWRVAALAAMLTIPFLCAAALQALARTDVGLLARAALGYLPLSLLGVSLAAPLTMLLLSATDQMCAVVSASAADGGARFLLHAAQVAGALAAAGSPFFAVFIGLFTVMAALALAVELLVRAAAVYVVVLMLPLAFAAMVWPARRVWAARMVELLVSLILSKFVIVAVLSLAASAFAGGTPGVSELLVAMALITLSTLAPWALMRILPFTEIAAGASGILRHELSPNGQAASLARTAAGGGDPASELMARLHEQARTMYVSRSGADAGPAGPGRSGGDAGPAGPGPSGEPDPRGEPGPELDGGGGGWGATPDHGSQAGAVVPEAPVVPDEQPAFLREWREDWTRLDHHQVRPAAKTAPTEGDGGR
jgi:hypothetical protein